MTLPAPDGLSRSSTPSLEPGISDAMIVTFTVLKDEPLFVRLFNLKKYTKIQYEIVMFA